MVILVLIVLMLKQVTIYCQDQSQDCLHFLFSLNLNEYLLMAAIYRIIRLIHRFLPQDLALHWSNGQWIQTLSTLHSYIWAFMNSIYP